MVSEVVSVLAEVEVRRPGVKRDRAWCKRVAARYVAVFGEEAALSRLIPGVRCYATPEVCWRQAVGWLEEVDGNGARVGAVPACAHHLDASPGLAIGLTEDSEPPS